MSHHSPSVTKKHPSFWRQLLFRLTFVAAGLLLIGIGIVALHQHHFAWTNWYGQTIFAAGVIGTGIVIALLCLLPGGDWFYRRITTRPPTLDEQLHRSHELHKRAPSLTKSSPIDKLNKNRITNPQRHNPSE